MNPRVAGLAPAMGVAFGAGRAKVLPVWGRVSLWAAAPALPLLLILGGLAEGSAETLVVALMLALFAVGWVLAGLGSRT